ncbi:hypothetical protein Ac2012v2_005897 [Leucoagaricus gongylophorus]
MAPSGEFWVAYQFASRGNASPTTQLIELELAGQKLSDLEDVLDYVFCQGFVEAHFRSVCTWVRHDGAPVHSSDTVEELVKQGVGKCVNTAVNLFVEDVPTALWFTYRYVYSPAAKVAIQRIRLNQNIKLQQIAHLTNHIFTQGYLPAPYRPLVYWETQCGVRLAEDTNITETLAHGFGVTEGKAIKLVVGELRRAFFFHCNITTT